MPAFFDDDDFEARMDAETLLRAKEIKAQSERLNAALGYLRSKADEFAQQADDLSKSAESDLEKGFTSLGRL